MAGYRLPIIRIQNLNDPTKPFNYTTQILPEKFKVKRGDTLLSWSGTPGTSFGCFRWDGPEGWLNQHIFNVRLGDEILPAFFIHQINSKLNELIAKAHGGVGLQHITKGALSSVVVAVPPWSEQKRIVSLLDEADELRKLRTQADYRTTDLLQALFHEVFHKNDQLKPVRVHELASLVTSGVTPRGGDDVYLSEGPYFIRSQNVQMNRLDLSDAVCLPAEVHEQMVRTKVAPGDVLLNITGASIGRVAWVDKLDREANVSQHVCLIRPKQGLLNSAYLSVFISLPATQHFILQVQAGASRQALNHQQVRALEIPLPPLSRQNEFARLVTEIRELEAKQAASGRYLSTLFHSFVNSAFRGEL
jgi:type I restriction enzyme, S subunit